MTALWQACPRGAQRSVKVGGNRQEHSCSLMLAHAHLREAAGEGVPAGQSSLRNNNIEVPVTPVQKFTVCARVTNAS